MKPKRLEKSSTSYLGAGCREFESRHLDQNPLTASAVGGFCIDWLKLENQIQLSDGQLLAAGLDGGNTSIFFPPGRKCKRVLPLGPKATDFGTKSVAFNFFGYPCGGTLILAPSNTDIRTVRLLPPFFPILCL